MTQSKRRLVEWLDRRELERPPVLIASEEEAAQLPGISIDRDEDERLKDEAEEESRKTEIYRLVKHEDENVERILDDIDRLQKAS